jgi:predicted DCC family thiol-disulfide oxidoreductase YuxK
MSNNEAPVLLFDGICNLCNSTVQFAIKRDLPGRLKFASLQSHSGQAMLKKFGLPESDFDSLVFITGGNCFLRSSAVLHVLKELGGGWKLLYIFIVIPRPLRDFFYNILAKNRYKLFGRRTTCMVPSPENKQRFLP